MRCGRSNCSNRTCEVSQQRRCNNAVSSRIPATRPRFWEEPFSDALGPSGLDSCASFDQQLLHRHVICRGHERNIIQDGLAKLALERGFCPKLVQCSRFREDERATRLQASTSSPCKSVVAVAAVVAAPRVAIPRSPRSGYPEVARRRSRSLIREHHRVQQREHDQFAVGPTGPGGKRVGVRCRNSDWR